MKAFLLILTVFLYTPRPLSASISSNYVKTEVIFEVYKCTKNSFNKFVNKMRVLSLSDCGYQCTRYENCRRIMYDTKMKLCFMYESGENCYANERANYSYCFRQENVCDEVKCLRCPVGYYGDKCEHIIKDCTDGFKKNITAPGKSLRSYIQPRTEILEVNCVFDLGGLTIISHRRDLCLDEISKHFDTTWANYSAGFGTIHGNYWLGLEHIYHILQNNSDFQLAVWAKLKGKIYQCVYGTFQLANQLNNYSVTIGNYKPGPDLSLTDALTNVNVDINGRPFSTSDKDFTNYNCPVRYNGGWWFANNINCSLAEITRRSKQLVWNGVTYNEIQLRLQIKAISL